MRIVTLALLVLFLSPAWASEPGQPLDCEEWVSLEPGYSCQEFIAYPCTPGFDCEVATGSGVENLREIDNDGNIVFVRMNARPELGLRCGATVMQRMEVVIETPSGQIALGHIPWRCVNEASIEMDQIYAVGRRGAANSLRFDTLHGRVYIPVRNTNSTSQYTPGYALIVISGFTPALEIMQSYEPNPPAWSFRVPAIPEGLQYADYFDTYYGDLATVGDWSQAQPLQCGYPANAPSAGDYLTVEDTLPTPASGEGYYYVTAVNYQGQRRYGRQSNGGVLTGRDPAVLPACAK